MKNVLSFASRIGLVLLGFFLFLFNIAIVVIPDQFGAMSENSEMYSNQLIFVFFLVTFDAFLGVWFITGLAERMVGKKAGYVIGAGMLTAIFLPLILSLFLNKDVEQTDLFWYLIGTFALGVQFAFCFGCFMMALDPKRLTFAKRFK